MRQAFTKQRCWRTTVEGLTREQVESLMRIRRGLIQRCHNQNSGGFEFYGARGIEVCQEWRESTQAFLDWAVTNGYRPGLEIDRKEGDGPYSPDNCRWVTHAQNAQNRRRRRDSGSRFKGVHRNSPSQRGQPWKASIFVNGKSRHVGYFHTEEAAARAYDAAALQHFGEFGRLNFPIALELTQ